jgi:hypothetical protein
VVETTAAQRLTRRLPVGAGSGPRCGAGARGGLKYAATTIAAGWAPDAAAVTEPVLTISNTVPSPDAVVPNRSPFASLVRPA